MKTSQTVALLVAALLLLSAAGCAAPKSTTALDDSPAEEYEVYSALIQAEYLNALIVIEGSTTPPGSPLFSPSATAKIARRQWPELGDDILKDFQAKNEKPSVLERRFTLSVQYVLISQQELESLFAGGSGWDEFYAKFPGSQGVLTLSRVGFNEAKDTAILYVGNQSHWLAGHGNVILMKKTGGRWTVQAKAMMWIS